MTLDELLRWHRRQAREAADDCLREIHREAVQLLTAVVKQRTQKAEKIKAGLAANRAAGKSTGGAPRIDPATEKRIRTMLKAGDGPTKIAAEVGCGMSLVYRVKNEMADEG